MSTDLRESKLRQTKTHHLSNKKKSQNQIPRPKNQIIRVFFFFYRHKPRSARHTVVIPVEQLWCSSQFVCPLRQLLRPSDGLSEMSVVTTVGRPVRKVSCYARRTVCPKSQRIQAHVDFTTSRTHDDCDTHHLPPPPPPPPESNVSTRPHGIPRFRKFNCTPTLMRSNAHALQRSCAHTLQRSCAHALVLWSSTSSAGRLARTHDTRSPKQEVR